MLTVDKDIPCGNALGLRAEGNTIRFAADPHDAPPSMWWCFRVRGEAGMPVNCIQEDARRVLGGSPLDKVRPVIRAGADGPWRRLPGRSCVHDRERNEFRFRFRLPAEETWVAYCYPHGPAELESLLAELAAHPEVQVMELCHSEAGRSVPYLRIGPPAGRARAGVMLTSRNHSGETPGTYVMEGFLRRVLRDDALGRRLRAVCDIRAIPWMDYDGVVEGRYGKDRPPVDYNRDWSSTPTRPEVRQAQAVLADMARTCDRLFFLDLHGPAPGNGSFLVPLNLTLFPEQILRDARVLADCITSAPGARRLPPLSDDTGPMTWSLDRNEATAAGYAKCAAGAVALSVESSYHYDSDGRICSPASWRSTGTAVAVGLDRFLRGQVSAPRPITDERMAQMVAARPHWMFWRRPENGAIEWSADGFSFEGTDASVYISRGKPAPVRAGEEMSVAFTCRLTGSEPACTARVRTLFYDQGGARLHLEDDQALVLQSGDNAVKLRVRVPEGAVCARPGWWIQRLNGRLDMQLG